MSSWWGSSNRCVPNRRSVFQQRCGPGGGPTGPKTSLQRGRGRDGTCLGGDLLGWLPLTPKGAPLLGPKPLKCCFQGDAVEFLFHLSAQKLPLQRVGWLVVGRRPSSVHFSPVSRAWAAGEGGGCLGLLGCAVRAAPLRPQRAHTLSRMWHLQETGHDGPSPVTEFQQS